MVRGQAKAETGMIQTVGRMVFVEFDSLHAHFNRPLNNQLQDISHDLYKKGDKDHGNCGTGSFTDVLRK